MYTTLYDTNTTSAVSHPAHIYINNRETSKGTVDKYLKFFLFALREKGGEGVEGLENMKLEEKPVENEQGGGGLVN